MTSLKPKVLQMRLDQLSDQLAEIDKNEMKKIEKMNGLIHDHEEKLDEYQKEQSK